jgi:hypothetical protein
MIITQAMNVRIKKTSTELVNITEENVALETEYKKVK